VSRHFAVVVLAGLAGLSAEGNASGHRMLTAIESGPREKDSGAQPAKLLDLIKQVDAKRGRLLLARAFRLVAEDTPDQRMLLAPRFASALLATARTPKDIELILGKKATKTVARQVFYRHYREQWTIEQPLPLCVILDCVKGDDPKVLTVLALPPVEP
jgi:hypothetical protein